jgi:UDP-N-acetylmuramoylalanine--D-glutamate ligase
MGNSGINASLLLNSRGARVMVTDSQNIPAVRSARARLESMGIESEIGGHTQEFIRGSELVVVSPGVEESSQALLWAKEYRIPVIGEMELGYRFCKGSIIAITGTNGKSTVTSLTGQILRDGGRKTITCGNIGNSLCGEIDRIGKDTIVVLEVSSFQLERTEAFKPHIAVILNITDDHLDRYAAFEDYFNEKLKVFKNQGSDDILILNYDSENLRPLAGLARSEVIFFSRLRDGAGPYLSRMKLKGLHNIENVIVSALIGRLCGIPEESIERTVEGFGGLPHRFETVSIIGGVEYIDDSKGTTVDSTRRALESCDRPVVLIAGGKDKFGSYDAVRDIVRRKVKGLILIGEAGPRIKTSLLSCTDIKDASDMREAVRMARDAAAEGDIVLLSPMCSSFDMFSSYKERGEVFRKAVLALQSPEASRI